MSADNIFFKDNKHFTLVEEIELNPGDYVLIEKVNGKGIKRPFIVYHVGEEIYNFNTVEEASGFVRGKYGIILQEGRRKEYTHDDYPFASEHDIDTAKRLWVAEYSVRQGCTHVEPLHKYLEYCRTKAIYNQDADFVAFDIYCTHDEAVQAGNNIKALMMQSAIRLGQRYD